MALIRKVSDEDNKFISFIFSSQHFPLQNFRRFDIFKIVYSDICFFIFYEAYIKSISTISYTEPGVKMDFLDGFKHIYRNADQQFQIVYYCHQNISRVNRILFV